MQRSLRHRAPLLWLVVPMIAGLVLGRCGFAPPVAWVLAPGLLFALSAVPAARLSPPFWAGLLGVSMVLAGLAAYRLHAGRLGEWDSLPAREVRLTLRCERVFTAQAPDRCSGFATVLRAEPHLSELTGRRLYFSLGSEALPTPMLRGALVEAKGVLSTVPSRPAKRGFDSYLADSGIQFRLSRGRVLMLLGRPGCWSRFCAGLLQSMERLLSHVVEEKRPQQSGAFKAMMLGQLGELSGEQSRIFRESGTMHLFSISGMHIGVIAAVIHGALYLMRLPRWLALILCLGLLWTYVDATGASPSAVRAFLMVGMVELAFALRQPFNALTGLLVSCLAVLLLDPCQLFGASFQMSYGIVAALVLYAAPLAERILAWWQPFRLLPEVTWTRLHHSLAFLWRAMVAALVAGFGASLVGLITGLHYFALLTPGALLVNLALIPVSSIVMFAGLASLAGGCVFGGAGAMLTNHSGCLVLLLMESFVRLSLRMPGMFYPGEFRIAWLGGAALCTVLLLCLWGYHRRWSPGLLSFMLPGAFVLLLLAFGVQYAPRP